MTDEARPELPENETRWSLLTRIGFRFAAVYLVLYALPLPLPGWNELSTWVGETIFGFDVVIQPTGSGDTAFAYSKMFTALLVAALVTPLWSVLDRSRLTYARLHDWLRIFVRYVLGYTMLSYGSYKLIKTQFVHPGLLRLLEPYGDSSPMGLLWTFMGFSTPYTIWAGAAEFVGGALLFFRRTTTLGALVLIAVMSNVVLMNLSYDVPVKQYSINLLLMAGFLTVPDVRRLWAVLVSNEPAPPADLGAPFTKPKANVAAHWIRLVLLVGLSGMLLNQSWNVRVTMGEAAPKPLLYGIYDVQDYVLRGDTMPPLATDSVRWERLVVDIRNLVAVDRMNGAQMRFTMQTDSVDTFRLMRGLEMVMTFDFERDTDGTMRISGVDEWGDSLQVSFTRRDESDFLLMSRGFRWMQEMPFNR